MNFLKFSDLNKNQIEEIIDEAIRLKKNRWSKSQILRNKNIGLLFEKPSTRTRISFEVGVNQLGGNAIVLNSSELQLSRGELVADTAKVLSGFLEGVMARVHSHQTLEDLATHGSIPVVNGLSNLYHPCQVLADFMTIYEKFNRLDIKIAYLGDGDNNMATSLMLASAILGTQISIVAPVGYQPSKTTIEEIIQNEGNFLITENLEEGISNADVIYTDVWVSMGDETESKKRLKELAAYQLNSSCLKFAPQAMILHCLPAHDNEEITREMIESKNSYIFEQAQNRLHAQKSLMVSLYK